VEVGASWLRELFAVAVLPGRVAARRGLVEGGGGPGARVVLIGHSFGARALVAAITQRPQLQAPTGAAEGFLLRRDPALLLEGAFEIDRLFDRDERTTAQPRRLEEPFSAGDPTLVLTASAFDKAVSAALWGWYAGDIRTYDEACGHASSGTPWRGFSFDAFGCGLARRTAPPAYGFDLCTPSQRVGLTLTREDARVRYMDATHVIDCTPPFSAGGSHSDIYRRETARFLLDELR
jgi:pimeloyl-ACP methyl ester carboxylesterase